MKKVICSHFKTHVLLKTHGTIYIVRFKNGPGVQKWARYQKVIISMLIRYYDGINY